MQLSSDSLNTSYVPGLYPVTADDGLSSPERDSNRGPRVLKYDVTDRMYKRCNDPHSSATRASPYQLVPARANWGATTSLMPAD